MKPCHPKRPKAETRRCDVSGQLKGDLMHFLDRFFFWNSSVSGKKSGPHPLVSAFMGIPSASPNSKLPATRQHVVEELNELVQLSLACLHKQHKGTRVEHLCNSVETKRVWWNDFAIQLHERNTITGWWLGKKPSEKYDFINWDDDSNPIWMGKCQIDGNQTTNQITSKHVGGKNMPVKLGWTPSHFHRTDLNMFTF